MKKFKICPKCQTQNDAREMDCINCGTDITCEPIISEEQYEQAKQQEEIVSSSKVRICENCGCINSSNMRKCSKCGEDISDIIPIDNVSEEKRYLFEAVDGQFSFEMNQNELVVGKEYSLKEYFADKAFVSRKHCKFEIKNSELFVTDLNSTNHTFVNNVQISEKTKLKENDEVSLGGNKINNKRNEKAAYFVVKVK